MYLSLLGQIWQVCDDTIEEDDGQGNQKLFRVIRVPFRVVFVSGNLKLRFHVQQSQKDGKVLHACSAVTHCSTHLNRNALMLDAD